MEGVSEPSPNRKGEWFPEGVNNALLINGEKVVEGPGAGSRATALRMFKDFQELGVVPCKVVLLGYGNVGKETEKVLEEQGIHVDVVVRSTGIYSGGNRLDDLEKYEGYLEKGSVVFISLPSTEDALHYYQESLRHGANIVTCEKAVLANNWELVSDHPQHIRYSATVGGNSGILPAIREFEGNLEEIRAVVNGTLNYICTELAKGRTKDEIYNEVISKGYAEPGAQSFDEVITNELKDVAYKAVILANHSGMYNEVITLDDVEVEGYREGARCSVLLDGKTVKAGFLS